MPKAPDNLRSFAGLLKVVEALRGPDGCPWDKEQTHRSLTRFAIEEAFELSEAIESGEVSEIRDELGDVLLQVVLHAEIARQAGTFTIDDVVEAIATKMVRRHPHVFGDVRVNDSAEVLSNWEQIKAAEKKGAPRPTFDIPEALPALLRAQKIGEKTRKLRFDWTTAAQVWPKVEEELRELREASTFDEVEEELGDVLFSVTQLARHLKVDAEQALRRANARFTERFDRMRAQVAADGLDWETLPDADRERSWKRAKRT